MVAIEDWLLYMILDVIVIYLYVDQMLIFFFFKQKTAYEMRISDWSSDVCSSDLRSRRSMPASAILQESIGMKPSLSGGGSPASARWPPISGCGDRKSVV